MDASSPLPAADLAEQIGVAVWGADNIEGLSDEDFRQLTSTDAESWSAFTLRQAGRDLVVFNPAQSQPRINSVVMHEIAHILLGHDLASAALSDDGHLMPSIYDQDQEDEANWLGGTLLLPRPALFTIRRAELSDDQAMNEYLVSRSMLTWRFRVTGVDYQLANMSR